MHAKIAVGKVLVHHVYRKDKNGNRVAYNDLYIRIGMERMKEIGLKPDEYYVMAIAPAQWYDLLDLKKDDYVYSHLPEDIKKHIDWLRKAEEEGVEIAEGQEGR